MSFLPLAQGPGDPPGVLDPDELERKLRDASPDREVTPFSKDMTDEYKEAAYEYHRTLVKMGGRPTRSVLEEPVGKAVYKKEEGIIEIIDEHGKRTCTLAYDMCPINYHWSEESSRFHEELDRWTEFQDYQRRNPQLSPLNTAFDLNDADEPLKGILIRFNEWREFEVYHQCKVDRKLMATWRNRAALEQFFQEEAAFGQAAPSLEFRLQIGSWFDELFPRQIFLDAAQKQLTWIENQGFQMLLEASACLENSYLLRQQLEGKMEGQTTGVWQELEFLGARPSRPTRVASSNASYLQRILHWKLETSRLLKDHREWRMFLKWRRNQAKSSTSVSIDEKTSNGCHVDPALWLDYVTYRQIQLNNAKSWVGCWRRLQRSIEKKVEELTKTGIPVIGGSLESAQQYVELFEQDVSTADAQLRLAQQRLAELTLQPSSSPPRDRTPPSSKLQQSLPSPPDPDAIESRSNDGKPLNLRDSPTRSHWPIPTQSVVEDHTSTGLPSTSEVNSKVNRTKATRKLASSNQKVSKPRKARVSKVCTEQQTMALLNAASNYISPKDAPP